MTEHDLYKDAIKSNLANKERIRANVLNKTPKRRQWPIAAAACLCVGLAATMAVPSARAAVSAWFNTLFVPKAYVETPKEERAQIPALEEAITTVAPKEQPVIKIVKVKEGWENFAQNLSFDFDEIFYDGQEIIVTGEVQGESKYFMAQFMPTGIPPSDFHADVWFTLESGLEGGRGMIEPVPPQEIKDILYNLKEATVGPVKELEPYISQNRFRFSAAGYREGLEGSQSLNLRIDMGPMVVEEKTEDYASFTMDTAVTVEVTGLQFDATAAQKGNILLDTPSEAQIGDAEVSLLIIDPQPEGAKTATMRNVVKNLQGGRLAVESIERRITGLDITFGVYLPDGWTEDEADIFMRLLEPKLIVNGMDMGGFADAYSGISIVESDSKLHRRLKITDVRILPADWENIESLELQLVYSRTDAYNGVVLPDGVDVTVPYDGHGWTEDNTDIDLPVKISIPLR